MNMNALHGHIANTAFGKIDDAFKRQIIIGLRDHTQIRHRIANFAAFVKAQTADHLIWNAQRDQAFFKFTGLGRCAHQHRHG